MRWILQRQRCVYNAKNFAIGNAYIGDRGFGQFYIPKSPYFALAQEWMKYEDFIYALVDCRSEIEEIFAAIDESYSGMYEQLCAAPELKILNFGENVADAYLSVQYWEDYCIPWYEKRSGQLRAAGKFTHIHIDGYFRPLLPYLKTMPFDGYEALTPTPQGDVSLEEIRDAIGEKVLLDGIPAVLFLKHQPVEQLKACVDKLIEYFHPRLVLGISDELPEGEGEEAYVRMKWVSEYCRGKP